LTHFVGYEPILLEPEDESEKLSSHVRRRKQNSEETRSMTRSLINSGVTAAAFLITIVAFDSATSQTTTPPPQQSQTIVPQKQIQLQPPIVTTPKTTQAPPLTQISAPGQAFVATAYSLRGRTASGQYVKRGIIAADRRVLPLGTRVRLSAGSQSGDYLVADTGGAIRGRKIDIWVPSTGEAMRFGRRNVKLTVLEYPRRAATRPRRVRATR